MCSPWLSLSRALDQVALGGPLIFSRAAVKYRIGAFCSTPRGILPPNDCCIPVFLPYFTQSFGYMMTVDAYSNVKWAAEPSEPARPMGYLIQWEGPTFGPGRSVTVTLHDESALPSGWTARVRAYNTEPWLSDTPQGFQNVVSMIRRVLTAESQKTSDHSWAACYLPEYMTPTAQQLATTAVAESLRGGAFAYPMDVRVFYTRRSDSVLKTLSGDRIMPVTRYGPLTRLDPPLSSYCTFMNEPPSIYIRQYPPGSTTDSQLRP